MEVLSNKVPVGRWPTAFERREAIKPVIEPDVIAIFRFFNEVGIINQLSQSKFESVMPAGMSLAQFSVLNHFVRLGRIESPARLAKAFQVTKGAMTNTLGRLQKQGFVVIKPDPDDGRAKLIEITDAGRQAQQECISKLAPLLIKLNVDLGVEDFAKTMPQLEKIRNYLDNNR